MSSTHTGLQNALNKLEKYCLDWQLTVNIKKTKVMTFQNTVSVTPTIYYKQTPLLETKEYNFLGNTLNYRGNFKRATQELTTKGLKVLFYLKSCFSNFHSMPVTLSCKLFDTLIRPVLLYNSEIWFMENHHSTIRSLRRSEQHNTFCDTISIEDKFSFEKVHNRYCKSVLGLKKTACNISAKTELGRLPLSSFIKVQSLLYFLRLDLDKVNPLLKEAFELNKELHNDGVYTWYSYASSLLQDINIDMNTFYTLNLPFEKLKASFKRRLKQEFNDLYTDKMINKLSATTESSKLYLYSKLKNNIKMEPYLLQESSFKNRQIITKFRVSDHPLEIELGRYKNVPRENRLCKTCNEIDDEYHFFLNCKQNLSLRDELYKNITSLHVNFKELQPFDKINKLLNPDKELLAVICDFIKQSLELRK